MLAASKVGDEVKDIPSRIAASHSDPRLTVITEPMAASIEQWKSAGLRLVLFSNISPIHADFVQERYPVFGWRQRIAYSFSGAKPAYIYI